MTLQLLGLSAGLALMASLLTYRVMVRLGPDEALLAPSAGMRAARSEHAAGELVRLLGRLAPLDRRDAEEIGRSLASAGSEWSPAQIWAMQLAGLVLGAATGTLLVGSRGPVGAVVALAGAAAGFTVPRAVLVLSRRRWHRELARELPDMLDLLSVAVTSGTTLDDGLRIVSESMEGALSEACGQVVRRANQEPVARGFERFAAGTGVSELASVGHAIAHATDSGAPISKVLLEQAKRLRTLRKLQVDEDSAKLDNQITVVCGLLVMPAAFASALLPYVWSIVQQFGSM